MLQLQTLLNETRKLCDLREVDSLKLQEQLSEHMTSLEVELIASSCSYCSKFHSSIMEHVF